jgi:hypothetical protein
LIRRLSFDLIGLPPSPREIDDFVQNQSPKRTNNSSSGCSHRRTYGERWGRHWLDVARYTESQGFEYDKLRDNAWHYRDYVIKSFNDDKPYDRFMKEQVAGDVLEPVTSDGIVGASLLVCGPWGRSGKRPGQCGPEGHYPRGGNGGHDQRRRPDLPRADDQLRPLPCA